MVPLRNSELFFPGIILFVTSNRCSPSPERGTKPKEVNSFLIYSAARLSPGDPVSRPFSESEERYFTWFVSSLTVTSLFPEHENNKRITIKGKVLMIYFMTLFVFIMSIIITETVQIECNIDLIFQNGAYSKSLNASFIRPIASLS